MNFKLVLVSALAAGVMTTAGLAQTPSAPAPSAPTASTPAAPGTSGSASAPPALPAPQAVPAKIAVIEFEEVTAATNEGQKVVADVAKKYEAQRTKLEGQKAEIDSLTKQLQNAPATMSDDEKASRARTIDTKQKQLQRDADDYSTAANADAQDALGKVAQKIGPVVIKYVQQNGYTMLLDNTGRPQQGGLSVLWAPGTDISEAVVNAYNAASGVAAPAPSAPSPSATRPRPSTPRPAAPKQ
jgi:outer membrane protein